MRFKRVICGVCMAVTVFALLMLFCIFGEYSDGGDVNQQQESAENGGGAASSVRANGTVKLNRVRQPMFEDVIAELEYNGIAVDVQWGIGDLYYMWYKSGYPGFGYCMVIESLNLVSGTGDAVLETEYGKYVYEYQETLQAYCKDDALYWAGNDSVLTKFGVVSEILYLYNPSNHVVQVYSLVEQTEIVL